MSSMHLMLALSIAAFAIAPGLHALATRTRWLASGLDGFVTAALGALMLSELMPHAVADAGALAIGAALLGLLIPIAMERGAHVDEDAAHRWTLLLAVSALAFHAFTDGMAVATATDAALAHDHGHDHGGLGWGVILHRVPVGLALWSLVVERVGWRAALASITALATATVAGALAGENLMAHVSVHAVGIFQGLVCGMLVHVLFHSHSEHHHGHHHGLVDASSEHPHEHRHSHEHEHAAPRAAAWRRSVPEICGAVLGLAAFGVMPEAHGHASSGDAWHELGGVVAATTPTLLAGLLAVALAYALLPRFRAPWLNAPPALAAARGIAVGLPLPMCGAHGASLLRTLRRGGASPAGAVSFASAGSAFGVATAIVTWALLGPVWLVLRVLAAVLLAMATGTSLARGAGPWQAAAVSTRSQKDAQTPRSDERASAAERPRGLGTRLREGARFALVDVVDDAAGWWVVGVGALALAVGHGPLSALSQVSAPVQVVLALVFALPMYVSALGATPIAAAMLTLGFAPAAVATFLVASATVHVGTASVLSGAGLSGAWRAFAATVGIALGTGVVAQAMGGVLPVPALALAGHGAHNSVIAAAATVVVGLCFAGAIVRHGPQQFLRDVFILSADHAHPLATDEASHKGDA